MNGIPLEAWTQLEVWTQLDRALASVGHGWAFDSDTNEVECKTCHWYAEGSFLDAVKLADGHRKEVKAQVLRAFLAALEGQDSVGTDRSEP